MKRAIIIILFFSVLFAQQSAAQSYHFRNYSVEDGLPFINVSTIFQDSKGNLWSGGYGGLSKFDGISFTNYTPKEGLLNHSVTCITEDNKGNLWVGTIAGVNKFDGKIVAAYTDKNGLISNAITASIKDKKGNVWFGTDKGISKLTGEIFDNFSTKNGLVGNIIKCFYQDASGNIWIGTTEGISVFKGQGFTNYTTENGLSDNVINGITEDAQHNIWIATANGLCKWNNNKFKNYYVAQGLIDNNIKAILTDYKNTIWMATDKGIIKFENEKFTDYFIRKDQNSNLINCFYEDYERNLWIGTYAGLFKYRGNPFVSYGMLDGLTNSFIYGIIRDSKKTLWAGSQGGGMYKFENNHFNQLNEKNGLDAKGVIAIYEYTPGNLWLGTDAGLRIYDGKKFIKKEDSSGVFNRGIDYFYKDSKNNIWMGGNNEVFKYDGKKFTRYTFKTRHENSQVWTIVEDKLGDIWIGTYLGGLIKYDPSKTGLENFVECSEQLGFKNDSYLTSLVDKEGNLYFGSLDGVWMFNPSSNKKPVQFSEADGMSSALVYSLTFNKNHNEIWAGTNQGLNNINIAEYKRSGQKSIIPFGKEEGFAGVECNSNGNWVDEDGSIWFGTVYGITKYDPNEYIPNIAESKINITGFQLFYTDTVLTDQIHLSSDNNNITFTYSGICLTNPEKVKYAHILEGFEKKWSPASKERLANYSNLPPGTYTFKVISSNNEGVWNKVPAHYTFTIDIPFWQSWWFLISSSLLVILALILSIRYRVQKIKEREIRKTELNKKIANIESQALRAQMNPHFIFNTLSSIQHYISNNDTDEALKYLTKFAKLMRSIMDNSKQPMIPVAEEISALNLYLELEVMRFDKKFEYLITIDPSIDQNYDRIPSMLIQPYIENSIIHGLLPKDGAGKILLTIEKQGETILCVIEDSGIGRERSMEYKNHRVQQHKSMGMSITKERLDILNSSLNSNIYAEIIDLYENGEAVGTKIKLIIPIETNE